MTVINHGKIFLCWNEAPSFAMIRLFFQVLLFSCTFVQPMLPITSKFKTFWDDFMWLSTECELSFVSNAGEVPRVW